MRRLAGALILIVSLPGILQSQEPEPLEVRVVVEDVGGGADFSARELRDAATVLLTSKMPDIQVSEEAPLWLYIQPACISDEGGYSCALSMQIFVAPTWEPPFRAGQASKLTLWDTGTVMTGSPGEAFDHLRDAVGEFLDRPIANWRRLTEDQRRCWTTFLNEPGFYLVGQDSTTAADFYLDGPCPE